MSGGVYGGDEVGAVVFDIGSNSTRVGYAGEDSPKGDISTSMGVIPDTQEAMETETTTPAKQLYRYHLDPQHLLPTSHKEIKSPVKDCLIEDWDLLEKLLNFAYKAHIQDVSSAHPVLMSEAPWNTKAKREKLTEIMFEKYEVPAFFVCKSAVLSAYAHGRSTGVVLDSGASQTSAVPVHDGYVLQKGIVRSPIAGDVLTNQCLDLVKEWNVDLQPSYMIKSKKEVPTDEAPDFQLKNLPDNLTESYKTYMIKEMMRDFQKSCLQVSDVAYAPSELETVPSVHHEFPNGFTKQVGLERFRIGEGLFDTTHIKNVKNLGTTLLGAPHVINTSIGMCDVDIRPALYNSVIVVGGTTLINGFVERLNRDLLHKVPNNMRLKLVSNNQSTERRFSSWIGGSILGSLGSFQQMWISRQEYDETGCTIVDKKCP